MQDNQRHALSNSCIPRVVMNSVLDVNFLNICHVNVQSICARQMSKFSEFKMCFENSKIDIICVTESWLTSDINDNLIDVDGYNLIRLDRTYSRGGGICVYLKNDINYKLVSQSELLPGIDYSCLTEYLFIEVKHNNDKFLLGVFYNPPDSDCSDVLFDKLSELSVRYINTVILGDFNTNWNKSCRKTLNFKNSVDSFGFSCVNSIPTHFYPGGCSQIDLILSSSTEFILNTQQVSAPAFSNHDIIFSALNIPRKINVNQRIYRDYNNIDVQALADAVNSVN